MPKKIKGVSTDYSVKMLVGEKPYLAEAPTITEAFDKLELGKLVLVGKVVITISHDGKEHQFFLPPIQARKLCINKNFQQIFEKRAKLFLGEVNL